MSRARLPVIAHTRVTLDPAARFRVVAGPPRRRHAAAAALRPPRMRPAPRPRCCN